MTTRQSPNDNAVLVLAGGPDGERDISITSGQAIADALDQAGYHTQLHTIERIDQEGLAQLPGAVVVPALHGPWGEGGPLQRLLERDGRPYVGAGPDAARKAMDKVFTKAVAAGLRINVCPTAILNPADPGRPLEFPFVVKPVYEGSTLGLRVCTTDNDWRDAHADAARSQRPTMIEPFIAGRELTVGLAPADLLRPNDNRHDAPLATLPIIEVSPADGIYDFDAKYRRADTGYLVAPPLDPAAADRLRADTLALAAALGARHLGRADFILDDAGVPWLLEINTMPGFTPHSLVPMAAAHLGIDPPRLCAHLVETARRDHAAARREETQTRRKAAEHAQT